MPDEAAKHAWQGVRHLTVETTRLPACVRARLDAVPEAMTLRRQTVEHVFGSSKAWMGSNHCLTRTLPRLGAEMSLQVLAHNLKRAIQFLGTGPLIRAMRA